MLIRRDARIAQRAKKNGVEFLRKYFDRAPRKRDPFAQKLIRTPIEFYELNWSAGRLHNGENRLDRFRRNLFPNAIARNDRDARHWPAFTQWFDSHEDSSSTTNCLVPGCAKSELNLTPIVPCEPLASQSDPSEAQNRCPAPMAPESCHASKRRPPVR